MCVIRCAACAGGMNVWKSSSSRSGSQGTGRKAVLEKPGYAFSRRGAEETTLPRSPARPELAQSPRPTHTRRPPASAPRPHQERPNRRPGRRCRRVTWAARRRTWTDASANRARPGLAEAGLSAGDGASGEAPERGAGATEVAARCQATAGGGPLRNLARVGIGTRNCELNR